MYGMYTVPICCNYIGVLPSRAQPAVPTALAWHITGANMFSMMDLGAYINCPSEERNLSALVDLQ